MELWHVLNRGIEKRDIVKDEKDRLRFIHDLFAFNDTNIVQHISQPTRRDTNMSYSRKKMVNIHAFCLMNNHYHLLLSEIRPNGVSEFMHKLNMGYTKYFNEKYGRSGVLWQGKHKKVLISNHAQSLYIPFYIHLNPLDYVMPQWRQGQVKGVEKAIRYLNDYRWSSHLDYMRRKNFPSVIYMDLLAETLGTPARYMKEISNIVSNPALATTSSILE